MKDLGRWLLVGGMLTAFFIALAMGKGKNKPDNDTSGYWLLPPFR